MDLVREKRRPNETLLDFIIRWRNLSTECELQISEKHLVELLIENIQGPIVLHLKSFEIDTFQVLLDKVARIVQSIQRSKSKDRQHKEMAAKQNKPIKDKFEANMTHIIDRKRKRSLVAVSPSGHTKRRSGKPTLKDHLTRKYSFTRESIHKILQLMIKKGLQLPEAKRPYEPGMVSESAYCPYHGCIGHAIEDCIVFKDLIEKKYRMGEITLSKKYLLPESSVHVSNHIGQTSQPEFGGHVYMVHASEVDTSPQEGEGAQSDLNQILWRTIQQKQDEITLLKTQNKGLQEESALLKNRIEESWELMRELAENNVKLKNEIKKLRKVDLHKRQNKEYSFKRESTAKLLSFMIEEMGMELPEPKFPHEIKLMNNPRFCPYHRCLGHTIEECYVFKDLLEEKYQKGMVQIPKKHLSSKMTKAISGIKGKLHTQPAVVPSETAQAHQDTPYLSSLGPPDEGHIIQELSTMARNSTLLEQAFSSKLKITNNDDNASSSQGTVLQD